MAYYFPFNNNPLKTRADAQQMVRDLFTPLIPYLSGQGAALDLNEGGAIFDMQASALEGVARPLWGIIPLELGGGEFPWWPLLHNAIREGVDPTHPHYWGPTGDINQRSVEMAAFGFLLALLPEKGWQPLSATTQNQLATWLAAIQHHAMPQNNWLFFTLLVQAGLTRVGREDLVDQALHQRYLEQIAGWYRGEGWYGDGDDQAIDHYGGFALHFYGLIYACLLDNPNEEYAQLFIRHARDFITPFSTWFADSGETLPIGRSGCYRFASAGFWGAAAMLPLEQGEMALVKGLWARHIRSWQHSPIFSERGLLTRGYRYPNLLMAEWYNSPTSPWWAMKAFLPLLLPETHPFWRSEESAACAPGPIFAMPAANSIAQRVNGHSIVHFAGFIETKFQWDKYNKFAYSTAFGPEMESTAYGHLLNFGDNILAFSQDNGIHWHMRHANKSVQVEGDTMQILWLAGDIEVETLITVLSDGGCRRRHRFMLHKPARVVETGFAVHQWHKAHSCLAKNSGSGAQIVLEGENGQSRITSLDSHAKQAHAATRAHTNLLSPRSVVPFLLTHLPAGEQVLESMFAVVPETR